MTDDAIGQYLQSKQRGLADNLKLIQQKEKLEQLKHRKDSLLKQRDESNEL